MTEDKILELINEAEVRKLTVLNLTRHNLTELPPDIEKLTHLEELYLSENYLQDLPSELRKLTSLKKLYLRSNNFSAMPPVVGRLISLLQLDLSENKISVLGPELGQLTKLKELYLSFNQLRSLPTAIGNLKELEELYLISNDIYELPEEIGSLHNLQELYLRSNQLNSLPTEIGKLSGLIKLKLDEERIESPPPEVVRNGTRAIVDYFRQKLEQGEDYLFEAKFIIVGEGGAGKTSLAKKIINLDYELETQEESTEGIDVIQWDFELRDGTKFRTNIWDFGGQEIYHNTHQFFLTKRSLYALVIDTRKNNTDLYYWLSIVNLLSDRSPVFIIKNERQDRHCVIEESQLRKEFGNIKEILPTNLKDNRGLNAIRQKIQHYISDLPHVGTPLPQKWVDVRRTLEADQRNYISLEEYYKICETNGFLERDNQRQLSEYLHDLGVCLHFRKDPVLKNIMILKPEWGTAAVYGALDTKEIIDNFGRFTRTQLNTIWSAEEYKERQDELLQLMMLFKLCYEIPGRPLHYIFPQLLSIDKASYDWNNVHNLLLRYRYDFMPKGLITRLIVELHEYVEKQEVVWQTGAVFTNGLARAEVIEDYHRSEIRIRVSGREQKSWLSVITHELEKIHISYDSLRYKILIPCNCNICQDSQTPHEYLYERLRKFIRDEQPEIQCQESYQMVNVWQLLDDILYNPNPNEPELDAKSLDDEGQGLPIQDVDSVLRTAQKQSFLEQELTRGIEGTENPLHGSSQLNLPSVAEPIIGNHLEVFVSFCHKDEHLKDELCVHLTGLIRLQKIQIWQDWDIEAGAEWDDEIKMKLECADIILLIISPYFIASDYCYKEEMTRAIIRHKKGTARVIPVIMKPCSWEDTPLKKLQALPKGGKPVTTWSNQDEALLNVTKEIHRVVESLKKS